MSSCVGEDNKEIPTCVAILLEDNGTKLNVLDVKGRPKCFELFPPLGSSDKSKKICFSTHGIDGLLTPCFDENGGHGEAEEGCFCGEDEPHIHAHFYDSDKCNGCNSNRDLASLAQLTLYPVTDESIITTALNNKLVVDNIEVKHKEEENYSHNFCCDEKEKNKNQNSSCSSSCFSHKDVNKSNKFSKEENCDASCRSKSPPTKHCCNNNIKNETCSSKDQQLPLMQMPISENLPVQCNSQLLRQHMEELSEEGFVMDDLIASSSQRKRMFKVKHENHIDYLTYNRLSGDLHLEHPCDSCGDNDHHGKLSFLTKRQLSEDNKDQSKNLVLHFFEISKRPVNMFDVVKDVFNIDTSNRVKSIRQISCCDSKEPCDCSTSTPPIIQDPCCANGIDSCCRNGFDQCKTHESCHAQTKYRMKTKTRSPKKIDETSCSSKSFDIEETEGCIIADKNSDFSKNTDDSPSSFNSSSHPSSTDNELIGRSQFLVKKICCSNEVRQIENILRPIEGVIKISINVTSKMAYIDHDVQVLSADDIAKKLNENKFGAYVKRDAKKLMMMKSFAPKEVFVSSQLELLQSSSPYDYKTCQNVLDEFSKDHLKVISFDQSLNVLSVKHNPYFISLSMVRHDLLQNAIDSKVLHDGSADGKWTSSLFPDDYDKNKIADSRASKVNPFVVLSGLFWIISMLSYIGDNWKYLKYTGIISVLLGLPPIAMKAFYTLKRCQFDTNCMMLFAVCGAVGLQDFSEAAAVTFLFSISEWLEMCATSRARNALSAIVNLRPDKANLINPITNEIIVIPAASIGIGAIVAVKAGDKIPCDGLVIEGTSTVDESSLTGEARPIKKTLQDIVSGGTINCGSTQLVIKATATVDNSAVGRLIKLVEEAQANKSPTEKVVDNFARLYTPVVVFASICMCTIPWALGTDVGRTWTYMGLILIVVACPCALIISTPVTYVAGLAATAQKGVVIKGGAHLEALGKVKTIAFDKTGTLTEGNFELIDLRVIADRIPRKKLLEYLIVIEDRATHPLAAAIVKAAKREGITSASHLSLENHTFLAGEGVNAKVNGEEVYVGNIPLFRRLGLYDSLPDDMKELALKWANDGGTVGFISVAGNGIVGAYCVTDSLRKESRQVVESLSGMGINCHMLTGDGNIAASSIGRQVGLSPNNVNCQLKPEDKLNLVKEMKDLSDVSNRQKPFFKKKELVLMCGDGINDAPALASAHVGVAMGEGAALAMETSDVTLMDSNLNKLLYSIQMGSRVNHTIIQNIAFSISVKAAVMAFTFAGKSSLWAAIVSDVGAMLLVTLNGMRLLPSKKSVNAMESSLNYGGIGNTDAV